MDVRECFDEGFLQTLRWDRVGCAGNSRKGLNRIDPYALPTDESGPEAFRFRIASDGDLMD